MACWRGMVCSLQSVRFAGLPAIMREGAVGFRHLVHVFTLLDGIPPVVRRIEQLCRKPLGHCLLVTVARGRNDPADAERLPAHRADLDRNLVGGAADTAGADL